MVDDSLAVCCLLFVSAPPTTPDVVENQSPPLLTVENIAAIAGAGEPSLSQLSIGIFHTFTIQAGYLLMHKTQISFVAKSSQILPNILNLTLTAT